MVMSYEFPLAVAVVAIAWRLTKFDGTLDVFSVTGNVDLLAHFKLADYLINCSVNPIDAGFTSGCGFARYSQETTIKAESNDDWTFINWTENGDTVSTDVEYTFTVMGNRDLVANFGLISGVEIFDGNKAIPDNYYLSNAYPNPFNPESNFQFGLPEESIVKLIIFDISGQIVETVLNNSTLAAGNYVNHFYAARLTSGVYFYLINANSNLSKRSFKKSGKLILLK